MHGKFHHWKSKSNHFWSLENIFQVRQNTQHVTFYCFDINLKKLPKKDVILRTVDHQKTDRYFRTSDLVTVNFNNILESF